MNEHCYNEEILRAPKYTWSSVPALSSTLVGQSGGRSRLDPAMTTLVTGGDYLYSTLIQSGISPELTALLSPPTNASVDGGMTTLLASTSSPAPDPGMATLVAGGVDPAATTNLSPHATQVLDTDPSHYPPDD